MQYLCKAGQQVRAKAQDSATDKDRMPLFIATCGRIFFLLPHFLLYSLLQLRHSRYFIPDTHMRSAMVIEMYVAVSYTHLRMEAISDNGSVTSEMTVVRMLARNRKSTMTTKIPPSNNDF